MLWREHTGAATSAVRCRRTAAVCRQQRIELHCVIPVTVTNAQRQRSINTTAHDITFSADGSWMHIISGKSDRPVPAIWPAARPSRASPIRAATAAAASGVEPVSIPLERLLVAGAALGSAAHLTEIVAKNNFYSTTTTTDRKVRSS